MLGVPNLSGAITASAEAGLQIVRLSSVCPPSAVRPHIQEGYLLGDLEALQSRLRLDASAAGEVVIRHIPAPVDPSALLRTETVVALDLMDSDDVRERAAGREALDRLLHRV